MRLGVPQKEVISALKANGISDETIKMLQTGKIKPYEASKQAIKKAQESGAKDRIDAYNRTYTAFKIINLWPLNGWQYEELSTGFRFKASFSPKRLI